MHLLSGTLNKQLQIPTCLPKRTIKLVSVYLCIIELETTNILRADNIKKGKSNKKHMKHPIQQSVDCRPQRPTKL